jgi:hypothetical protein
LSALILALAACDRLDHALAVRPQNTSKGWNADAMHHVDLHQLGNGTWIAAVSTAKGR